MENYKSAPLKVITEELQITDAPIKALVKRDSFQKSMWKYTEIRMTMMILNKQNHFHLRRNKNKLLHRFYHQLQMKLIIHFTIWCYRKWKDRSIFTIYSECSRKEKKLSFLFLNCTNAPNGIVLKVGLAHKLQFFIVRCLLEKSMTSGVRF